nr:hypothetical protein GCM10020093_101570 [Planobispora longispora]
MNGGTGVDGGAGADGVTGVKADGGAGAALAVEAVSVSFGGVRALSDVSFEVPPGQVCGVIGPNGAGKTTLFDVISGLRRPPPAPSRWRAATPRPSRRYGGPAPGCAVPSSGPRCSAG